MNLLRLSVTALIVLLCSCGSIQTIDSSGTSQTEFAPESVIANIVIHLDNVPTEKIEPHTKGLVASLATEFTWNRHLDRKEVREYIDRYKRNPAQLEQLIARSADFLPLIADQVRERQLPTELVFLPLIESSYQTNIYSQAGAAGLWQLMPATAQHLGLKIDWWYDQRLDIPASTAKALDYLEYLEKQFDGSWELAIAAYNGGEGHLRSKMRQAKSKNLWDLTLKQETTAYLPRLLAVVEILNAPSQYGVKIPEINSTSQLAPLQIEKQIDLRLAASLLDMDFRDFKILNASYQHWVSPPNGNYQLLLPKDKAKLLAENLTKVQPDQLTSWDHYRVQSGDTLSDIAREFGTTLRALMAVNELKNSRIYARQELLIPSLANSTETPKRSSQKIKELYIVQSGDSLWTIANRNSLSLSALRKLNSIYTNSVIQPGQVLILSEYFQGESQTYEVKLGDSLSEIAHQFDVTLSDLKRWNKLDQKDLIRPGQILEIRTDS